MVTRDEPSDFAEFTEVVEEVWDFTETPMASSLNIGFFDGYGWSAVSDHDGTSGSYVSAGNAVKPWQYHAAGWVPRKVKLFHDASARVILYMSRHNMGKYESEGKDGKKGEEIRMENEEFVEFIGVWSGAIHEDAPVNSVWRYAPDVQTPCSLNGQPVPLPEPSPYASSSLNGQPVPIPDSPFTPAQATASYPTPMAAAMAAVSGMNQQFTPMGSNAMMSSPGAPMQQPPMMQGMVPFQGGNPMPGMQMQNLSMQMPHAGALHMGANLMMNQHLSIPRGLNFMSTPQVPTYTSPMSVAPTPQGLYRADAATSPMMPQMAWSQQVPPYGQPQMSNPGMPRGGQVPQQQQQHQAPPSQPDAHMSSPPAPPPYQYGDADRPPPSPAMFSNPQDSKGGKKGGKNKGDTFGFGKGGHKGPKGLGKGKGQGSTQAGGGGDGDGDDGGEDDPNGGGYGGDGLGGNGAGGNGNGGGYNGGNYDPMWSHLHPEAIKKQVNDDPAQAAYMYGAALGSSFVNRNQHQSFSGAGHCPKFPTWSTGAALANKVLLLDGHLEGVHDWGARIIGNGGQAVMSHVMKKAEEYFWIKKISQNAVWHTIAPDVALPQQLDVASYDVVKRIYEEVAKNGCQQTVGEAGVWFRRFSPGMSNRLHPFSKLVAYLAQLLIRYKVADTEKIAEEVSTPKINSGTPQSCVSKWLVAWDQLASIDYQRAQLCAKSAALSIRKQLRQIYRGDEDTLYVFTTQSSIFYLDNPMVSWQACISFLQTIVASLSDTVCPVATNAHSGAAYSSHAPQGNATTRPTAASPSMYRCIPDMFNRCSEPCPLSYSHDRKSPWGPNAFSLVPKYATRHKLTIPGFAAKRLSKRQAMADFEQDVVEEDRIREENNRNVGDIQQEWQMFMAAQQQQDAGIDAGGDGGDTFQGAVPFGAFPSVSARMVSVDMYGACSEVVEANKALSVDEKSQLPCVWWEGAGFCPRHISCGKCLFQHKGNRRGLFAKEFCDPKNCSKRGSCAKNHGKEERIVPAADSPLLAGIVQMQAMFKHGGVLPVPTEELLREAACNSKLNADIMCEHFSEHITTSFKNMCDIPIDLPFVAACMLDTGANGPVMHKHDKRFVSMSERTTFMHTSDNKVASVPVGIIAVPFAIYGKAGHDRNDPPVITKWIHVSSVILGHAVKEEYSPPIIPEFWFQCVALRTQYGYDHKVPLKDGSTNIRIFYKRNLPFLETTEVVACREATRYPWEPGFVMDIPHVKQDGISKEEQAKILQRLCSEQGESNKMELVEVADIVEVPAIQSKN